MYVYDEDKRVHPMCAAQAVTCLRTSTTPSRYVCVCMCVCMSQKFVCQHIEEVRVRVSLCCTHVCIIDVYDEDKRIAVKGVNCYATSHKIRE
jgi:hypothetical protein